MSWAEKIANALDDQKATDILNQAIAQYTQKLMEIYHATPMADMPILLTVMRGVYGAIMESVPDSVRLAAHHVMENTATFIISGHGEKHGTG